MFKVVSFFPYPPIAPFRPEDQGRDFGLLATLVQSRAVALNDPVIVDRHKVLHCSEQ
jgi:hypothetical protein